GDIGKPRLDENAAAAVVHRIADERTGRDGQGPAAPGAAARLCQIVCEVAGCHGPRAYALHAVPRLCQVGGDAAACDSRLSGAATSRRNIVNKVAISGYNALVEYPSARSRRIIRNSYRE